MVKKTEVDAFEDFRKASLEVGNQIHITLPKHYGHDIEKIGKDTFCMDCNEQL